MANAHSVNSKNEVQETHFYKKSQQKDIQESVWRFAIQTKIDSKVHF